MPDQPAQFSCNSCGRKFTWKPALAGKKARCKCGVTIEVPASITTPTVQDDLYDFVDAPPSELPRVAVVAPPVAVKSETNAPTLNYLRGPSMKDRIQENRRNNSMLSRPRDIYAPVAMFVIGFLMILAWAVFSAEAGMIGAVIIGLLMFALTIVKTVVLVAVAFGIAAAFGVNFGSFWTAILKLAAIVIFTEAMFFWIETWMEHIGAINSKGHSVRGFSLIFLLEAAIFAVQYKLLFDMESEDLMKIGGVTALTSRIVDFGLKVLFSALLGG